MATAASAAPALAAASHRGKPATVCGICYTTYMSLTQADHDSVSQWQTEFAAAATRPLAMRFRYAFIHTYKPVLDDVSYRSFNTTAEYRQWCAENLPSWLGYGPSV